MAGTAPTPSPAPAGGSSSPSKDKGKIDEVVAAVATAAGGLVTVAAIAADGGKHAAAVARALANIQTDFEFASRHAGVNRAYWLNWFWHAWVVGVWLSVSEVFLQGSHPVLAGFAVAFYALQLYAWPVKSVSMLDHMAARADVDRARALVLELCEQRNAALLGATPMRSTPFDPQVLHDAEQNLVREQQLYQDFVDRHGANNRSSVFIAAMGWLLNAGLGLTMIYTIMGNHGRGLISYDAAFWPAVHVCVLPYVMFMTPAYMMSEASPFLLSQVSKADSMLTAIRRLIIAGLLIGPTYKDIVADEERRAALNGDDWNRTPTELLKRTVQIFLGVVMLKVSVAVALVLQHLLLLPSAAAFGISVFLAFALKGFENIFRSVNVHTELGPPWLRRTAVLSFLVYVHLFFAGGAPREYMGLGWYFSDYGPFGDLFGRSHVANTVETVQTTGTNVAHGVTTPVAQYGHSVAGLGLGGWLCWVAVFAIVASILVFFYKKGSQGVDDIKHKLFNKIALIVLLVLLAPLTFGGVYYVYHVPTALEERRTNPRSATSAQREIARQAERYINARDRSTAITISEGADALERSNAERENVRRCAKNLAGHPPCTQACYDYYHLVVDGSLAHEQELGYCYPP